MLLIFHIGQLHHVQISDTFITIYASYELTAINNVTRIIGTHTFHIIGTCPSANCPIAHIYTAALTQCSKFRCYITANINKKKPRKLQIFTVMLLPYICLQQICPSNSTYANYFMCRYETTMSVYVPHMNSLQSIMLPEALEYVYFTLMVYAHEQICLSYFKCPTSVLLYCIYKPQITAHVHQKSMKYNINLLYYSKMCTNNKYTHWMP